MRFDLKAKFGQTSINYEFDAIHISDLLENLESFIKAAGFKFEDELNIFDHEGKAETVIGPSYKTDTSK